jgi:hypothetical protein
MSRTDHLPIVFTAQSKAFFYCRDAVCEFVFNRHCVPLNPFRVFEYFLGDRVDRDAVRQANNNLLRIADEIWVFGHLIADGVLFEIRYAQQLNKPLRFFTIANRAAKIREISVHQLKFEPELHGRLRITKEKLFAQLSEYQSHRPKTAFSDTQLSLFDDLFDE